MKKIRVKLLFEDEGFCKDTFITVYGSKRYFNRDTESGIWFSSDDLYFENGFPIDEDIIFEIFDEKLECIALDGNGDFDSKKPFVPLCERNKFRFEYMMLSRLKMDCDYYLGTYGCTSLWGVTIQKHIAEMRRLYDFVPEKPEWLTIEDIDEYERRMNILMNMKKK